MHAEPARDGDGHRGVAAGVPAAPAASCPLVGPHRPARPDVRLRRQRRARGEGDPHRRQALLGGARAPLRPRRRRRRRPPATSSASSPRPRRSTSSSRSAWSATRPAGCSTSSPTRARPASVDRRHARGDAGQRDDRAGRAGCATETDVDARRGRRQPGAARAVQPRRGGDLRRAARRRAAVARSAERGRAATSARCSTRARARGHAAAHRRRAPRPTCASDLPADLPLLYVPVPVRPRPRPAGHAPGGRGARRGAGL